jgi:hypothetical protein
MPPSPAAEHADGFVPLEDQQVGFFPICDGEFDTYIADFKKNIGQVFYLLFKFTKGAYLRLSESTFKSSSTSPPVRTGHRLASIKKPIRD